MKVRQAVMMVGGKGTRLLPLTLNTPKPVLPVVGHPCMWYLARSLARAGVEEIILACGYRSEKVPELMGDGSDLGVRFTYVYESEPLGTGGAIKAVEDILDPVFIAVNGDVFCDIDLRKQIDIHFDTEALVTISLTTVDNPWDYGTVEMGEGNRIVGFKEKPPREEVTSNLINAGVYVVDKRVLEHVPSGCFYDFSKELFPHLMEIGGRMSGVPVDGVFMDVGKPHELLCVNLLMAQREHSDEAYEVTDCTVDGTLYVGPDQEVTSSRLSETVLLGGGVVRDSELDHVLVMDGASIEGARITNSIIGVGCVIGRGSVVSNSVLGDGETVAPGEIRDDGRNV